MSTTTMHFGPEWMRTKQHPAAKALNPPSPPSAHSSLASMPAPFEKRDEPNPFRYSKEDMLRIYKESDTGGLGLDIERWEAVVREGASEPVSLREMDEAEKKLFAGSINSGPRRRPSGDYLTPLSTSTDRTRLNYTSPVGGTPLRERFGPLRRRDSTDSPTSAGPLPRKLSIPSLQNTGISSSRDTGLPSPRNRVGITPSFDGGDAWTAHRRVSDKSAVAMSREASSDLQSDIQEEQEGQDSFNGEVEKVLDRGPGGLSTYQADYRAGQNSGSAQTDLHNVNLRASHSKNAVDYGISDGVPSGPPPPGLHDLASVEWSYKDPTGQVQGPFRADLMQKWFDEGYFSLDLPTKRTHLDSHWITVEDLLRRASDEKIFLSVPLPPAPPGLTRRTDSPLQPYSGSTEQDVYGGLNHPSPIRTLRNSTLDNYVATGSNPSDSPSSFGGARFGNGSPDSIGLGGRAANPLYYMGPSVNGRTANLVNVVDAPAPFVARRATLNDATLDHALMRPQAYPSITPSRTASMGEYGLNGMYNPGPYIPILDSVASSRSAEPLSLNTYSESPVLEPALNYRNGHDGGFHENVSGNTTFSQSDYGTTNSGRLGLVSEEASPLNHYSAFGSIGSSSVHGQAQFSQTSSPFLSHANAQPSNPDPLDPHPTVNIDFSSDAQAKSESSIQSPWQEISDVSAPRRGASSDVSHPPESTTIALQPPLSRVSPWGNKAESSQQLPHIKNVSPWTSQATASDSWKGEPHHDRLTFSNVVQHNQQYLSNDAQVVTLVPESSNPQEEQIDVAHTPSIENESAVSGGPVQREKFNSQLDQERGPEGTGVTADTSDTIDTTTQVPAPKVAWSKEPGPSISLREIQEAEAKKVETRKAVERVTRNNSVSVELKEEVQPFTTSWGLPSSQAGTRSSAPLKEATSASSPSASAPPAPVWTNAVKSSSAKKSMKEIQEEEERRKRLLAAKEPTLAAAAAARKAPPEMVNKASTNPGGAWTVVGHSGKIATPVAVSARSPSTTVGSVVVSTPSTSRMNGSARPVAPALAKAPSSAPKIDEFPPAPSHDFLRWLTETLKGLNNSVNVEEIMSMLLSFPLDPDPSTVELISDLIYTNSTTLDGRRFAAEYINKRKSDAASRAKSAGSSGKIQAKPVSIADVVKAVPKPAQSDWNFKVVNKKKKGGRT